ncbi:Uncharacterized membrane protein C977.17,Aquaporin-8,Aquaporin-9,Aquaporin-3,Aquaporin-7,Aquaporin-2,Aquaporin-4,Putative aquaporin-7-like protein 3,Aquaporin-10 [Mytilus coruscus]|uniref:Uncharacterized membrane protein C977.17,Aquaporin-8,Aquaporin-9,Aquaporin-3,Aquaporin-7,Aqu aporin-2,Aquaporin-4,Putative aquaporin-7-like protein 3,Aquaporin-10 n=1 Tax=Mytilus coruscus TaxID=42192 RepID=A0A6J8AB97_MYTCO|nr:Uncharacterized membrane protein C977.17,Aquaporin-8,Aquaporin-9,Aquaporin-3,Aquaporin-7,Aquaporin-2,Aquaporin-4,Putative aquaporin-7-like protein 3,Aquaporin-10 [Mytilus coruscus]
MASMAAKENNSTSNLGTEASISINKSQYQKCWVNIILTATTKRKKIFGFGSVAQAVLSGNTVGDHMSIHLAWGIGVTMGVYIAGGISGGHLNPAVTVALACIKKVPWKKVPFYMIGQYLGAFVASATTYFVYYDALNNFDGGNRMVSGPNGTAAIWATYPQDFASVATCIGDQLLGTAMLLCCVLAVTDDRNMETHKGLIPFSVGLIVVVIGMTYHLNCGYAINPARDLGPRIFTAIAGWGVEVFRYRVDKDKMWKYFSIILLIFGQNTFGEMLINSWKENLLEHYYSTCGTHNCLPNDTLDDNEFCGVCSCSKNCIQEANCCPEIMLNQPKRSCFDGIIYQPAMQNVK